MTSNEWIILLISAKFDRLIIVSKIIKTIPMSACRALLRIFEAHSPINVVYQVYEVKLLKRSPSLEAA